MAARLRVIKVGLILVSAVSLPRGSRAVRVAHNKGSAYSRKKGRGKGAAQVRVLVRAVVSQIHCKRRWVFLVWGSRAAILVRPEMARVRDTAVEPGGMVMAVDNHPVSVVGRAGNGDVPRGDKPDANLSQFDRKMAWLMRKMPDQQRFLLIPGLR